MQYSLKFFPWSDWQWHNFGSDIALSPILRSVYCFIDAYMRHSAKVGQQSTQV